MTVGIRIKNDYGGIQVNEQLVAWGQSATGTIVLTDDGAAHPQPMVRAVITVTGSFPIIAIRPRGGKSVGIDYSVTSGGQIKYYLMAQSNTAVMVDWWAFDTAAMATKDPTMQRVNMVVKDPVGVVTFDASMPCMRIVGVMDPGMPTAGIGEDQSTSASFTAPAGRAYAVVISSLGHVATMYDTGAYGTGSQPPQISEHPEDPEGGGPPLGATWREQILETYVGMVSASGATLTAGIKRFEYWRGWYPIDATPHLIKNGRPTFTVVDVTGYGGGQGGTAPNITVGINNLTPSATGPAGDIISPAVTASPSGGVAPYNLEWVYDSGNTDIVNYDATYVNPFRLRSVAQPAGTTRWAKWRVKATDANGYTGWSDPVTFTFTTDAGPDYSVNPITAFNLLQVSSNDHDVSWNAGSRQITGINQPITLRFERYNYSGNMAALYVDVFTGPSSTGPWTHHGFFMAHASGTRYLDVSGVTNGTWITYNVHAVTDSGRRTATCTLTVWNLSDPAGSVKLSDVSGNTFAIDNDDNYNNADYDLSPLDWSNCSFTTNDNIGAGSNAARTISGINRTVNLRFTLTSISHNFDGGDFYIYKNGVKSRGANGFGLGYWTDVDVVSGDQVYFYYDGVTNYRRKTLSGTITVTNTTTGATVDTFTISGIVDNDDNWNYTPPPDTTPDPISLSNQSVVTDHWEGYTPGTFFQITGINSPITIRISRGPTSDYENIFTRRLVIGYSNNGGASYTETNMGALESPIDFVVNNGDWMFLKGYFSTNAGRGSASWTTTVTNATTGVTLGSITVSGTVDNDNNYNVPDYTMNIPSLGSAGLYTNDPSGYTTQPLFQVTGINQSVNLRFTRSGVGTGMTMTGNIIYGRQYIGHSTNGGASWTTYLLTAAAGQEVNIIVNNGDYISYYGYIETSGGRASADWYTEITNTTAGQYLGYATLGGTVDGDNNFNVTALTVSVANEYSYVRQFIGSGNYYGISDTANVTVSGGLAPYTYKWTRLNGLVNFNSTRLEPGFSFYAQANWSMYSKFSLEVTDANGTKAYGSFTADWAAGDIDV